MNFQSITRERREAGKNIETLTNYFLLCELQNFKYAVITRQIKCALLYCLIVMLIYFIFISMGVISLFKIRSFVPLIAAISGLMAILNIYEVKNVC